MGDWIIEREKKVKSKKYKQEIKASLMPIPTNVNPCVFAMK